jgi:hypothetical protein
MRLKFFVFLTFHLLSVSEEELDNLTTETADANVDIIVKVEKIVKKEQVKKVETTVEAGKKVVVSVHKKIEDQTNKKKFLSFNAYWESFMQFYSTPMVLFVNNTVYENNVKFFNIALIFILIQTDFLRHVFIDIQCDNVSQLSFRSSSI